MTRFLFLVLAVCRCAAAVELHIQFGALERMLTEQVFSQEGRRYVHGSKTNKCNFAYLEKPEVRGEAGRLLMKARFTGRSALNVVGQCVGLGDAFDVVITAMPVYRKGAIGLQEVKVASGGKSGLLHPQGVRGDAGQPGKGLLLPAGNGGAEDTGSAGPPGGVQAGSP